MNLDISIKQRLQLHLGKPVTDELTFEATCMLLRVLFCMDNATILPRFFVQRGYFELARDSRELKIALLHNGYTLRNCKFFVHSVACKKATVSDYESFGVNSMDAELLILAADSSKVSTYCRKLAKDFPFVPMEKFAKALAEELSAPKMVTFMDKFLHKKLRWVMNTQGLRPYDIRTEFISHAIVRVYRTYPRIENRVHLRNLMRQVIHARGQSIIIETKKSKRNNLLRGSNGEFLGRLAPMHLIPQEVMDSNVDNLSCSITGGDQTAASEWVFRQDLQATIKAHATSVKKHMFLTAVFDAGKDPKFISYLRVHVNDIDLDGDELPDYMMAELPEELVVCAIDYSGLDAVEAVDLLRTIKEDCL